MSEAEPDHGEPADDSKRKVHPVIEVLLLFLKLGFAAFGGPAAHIAMYRDEVVVRRKWLSEAEFLDLLGAVNLIPGPNSTEMAIHIGLVRAGWLGLVAAGVSFIVPAMAIVTALAWAYTRYGTTPAAESILYGVQPVVIAVIAQAIWNLGRVAVRDILAVTAGLIALVFYFLGVHPLTALLIPGAGVMLVKNLPKLRRADLPGILIPWLGTSSAGAAAFSLPVLFLTFLKIGAVLYGSGYVLLAFLHAEFIDRLGWLTEQQLLDAVAVGQVTPGPVFTTATFIGYLLDGVRGGILATVGIFLPSFIFVALSSRIIPRLRHSPWVGSLLDGVNVASLGLMAAVTLELSRQAFVDPFTVLVGLVTAVLLVRYKVNSTWLILAGAAAGFLIGIF